MVTETTLRIGKSSLMIDNMETGINEFIAEIGL